MAITIADSKRLTFVLMDKNDGALLLDLDSDPEVMRYINGGKPSTQEDLDQVLMPRINAFTNPDEGWGLWRVNKKDDQTFIGWVLARPMFFFSDKTDYDDIELGWRFKRNVWGQGYATEAARAVMQGLHQQRQYSKFSAIAVSENIGSIKIMKKLGMHFIKKELHIDPLYREVVEYYQTTM